MRIVLLGSPGAGKGTQAKVISKKFDIPHISTGDILRNEIKRGSGLGKEAAGFVESGKLVPDRIIIEIIKNEISPDKSKNGFLMDGFPRNLEQARMFSDLLDELGIELDKVININVSKDEIVDRLSKRKSCSVCKSVFSIGNNKDLEKCPECNGDLIVREDDKKEVIKHRLDVYESETRPLIDFYADKGLLVNIDGSGEETEITRRILKVL
ncbi:MAG: adenylate kinase [Actinomycetota bacterium]|nr:adenylate kinase [Actinomycetota bacterium]